MIRSLTVMVFAIVLAGCADSRVNPCSVLDISEVQVLESSVSTSRWLPPGRGENELCMYLDATDERQVMLFMWSAGAHDPLKNVTEGMKGENSEVVDVWDVGLRAAAGFHDAELKLFSARSNDRMVGLRVRKAVAEDSADFEVVKSLVRKALGRLE